MACDEELAERIRVALKGRRGITEKKMFGGGAFLLRGNMLWGVVGSDLMVRVGLDAYEDALARPHAREMDFTGRRSEGVPRHHVRRRHSSRAEMAPKTLA